MSTAAGPATCTVGDVVAAMDQRYPRDWAEDWDSVGLTCGDPAAPVSRVHLALDPSPAVVEEALALGAQLLVTHHPLFLRLVRSVATTTPKGRSVHRLLAGGAALFNAHTNADRAAPGVSDALAELLGLHDVVPLVPADTEPLDALTTYVPTADTDRVLDALAAAGAGRLGRYERCAWTTEGTGTFVPLEGADPTVGRVGEAAVVAETRVDVVVPRRRRQAVLSALRSAHPYEEPAFDLHELAPLPGPTGLGRVGRLTEPLALRELAQRVVAVLPACPAGIRVGGDLDRTVRSVAVCGGAGDSLVDEVRASGADVYVTADLRHHPASEALEHGAPALIDAGHFATEWPWLPQAARLLRDDLAARGATVVTTVSTLVTDPWTLALAAPTSPLGAWS